MVFSTPAGRWYSTLFLAVAVGILSPVLAQAQILSSGQPIAEHEQTPSVYEALGEEELRQKLRVGGWSSLDDTTIEEPEPLEPSVNRNVRGRALYMVASADFKREKFEKAMQTYQNALEYLPGNPVVRLAIARCEMMLDDTEHALQLVTEVLGEDDQQIEAWQLKAEIHSARDNNPAMIEALEQARELQPMNVSVLADLADAYRRALNFEKMNEVYAKVASIEPRNLRALFFLSYGNEVLGKTGKAVEWIDQAIEKFPQNEQLHQRKIEILMKAREHKEVRKALLRAFAEARGGDAFALRYKRYIKQFPPQGDPVGEIRDLADEYPLNAKAQRFYIEALEAKGEFKKALELVEKTLKDHPDDGELLLRYAELLVKEGRGEEALDALEKAANTPILTPDQLMNLSELQARRGRTGAAIATLKNAMEEHPENAEIGIELATLLIRRDRNGEATDVLKKIEPLIENNIDVAEIGNERAAGIFGRYGALNLKLEQDKKAITYLQKAVELAPAEPKHWLLLYTAQLSIEDVAQAEVTFERFFQRGVDGNRAAIQQFLTLALNSEAYDLAGKIMEMVIDSAETPSNYKIALFGEIASRENAMQAMTDAGKMEAIRVRLIEKAPKDEQAYFTGLLWELLEQEDKALVSYRKQFKEKSRRYDTALRLIYLYGDNDRLDEARTVYDEVTESARIDEDYARLYDFHQQFATVLINSDLGAEARDILVVSAPDAEIRMPTRAAELYRVLGDVQSELGEIQEAHDAYEQAITLDPQNILALNNYGYNLAVLGERLDQAERLIKRALRISPNEGFILDSLGWVYYKKQEYDKAVQLLEAAIALDGGSWELHDHLAEAYKSMGRWEEALMSWENALELLPPDTITDTSIEAKLREARDRIYDQGSK